MKKTVWSKYFIHNEKKKKRRKKEKAHVGVHFVKETRRDGKNEKRYRRKNK